MNIQAIKDRSSLYSSVRKFFDSRGYLEVETPTLSPDLIPESTIENFQTSFTSEFCGSCELYMVPSPEIFMKRLISQGSGSIYQISKCFRNREQMGRIHNPEFSMLEYYTNGFDENDSISLTQDLIRFCSTDRTPQEVKADFEIMSVREAVMRYADGTDLENLQKPADLRSRAKELGLSVPVSEPWDDTFNRIFLTFVEPSLPVDHPVLLKDYPHQIECLAVRNGYYRHRWELYICGTEIANCYMEETNCETIRSYYRNEFQKTIYMRSESGTVIPNIDESFADIFTSFPKCSGVAVGLDRLLMVLTGEREIDNILTFPFSGFIK